MTIEKSPTALTVTFRRSGWDKWVPIIVAAVMVEAIYIALRINAFPQQTAIVCDRGKDLCTVSGYDIFGGSWTFAYPASEMKRSRVVADKSDDPRWIVERATLRPQELGSPTGRAAQQAQYTKSSAALQSFIDDPTQPLFEARFDAIGGPGDLGWAALIAFFGFVVLRYVNAWRARLVFDRVAGELAIVRTPALVPPARRTLPLAEVVDAESGKGGMFLLYAFLPTVTFRLMADGRRVLFKRRMFAARKSEAEVREDVAAINDFLRSPRVGR